MIHIPKSAPSCTMGCLIGDRRAAALQMKEDAEAEALQAEDDYHQDLVEPWS